MTQHVDPAANGEEIEIAKFTIRDVTIMVEGITPYSQSAHPGEDKEKSETWDDFEARVWRKKAHTLPGGEIFIPGDAFKLSLDEATKNRNEKIPGKAQQTWTGVFSMGIAAMSDMPLGVNIDDCLCERVFCHSNGKRMPGARVDRLFPILHSWGGVVTLRIFNDTITKEKFEEFFTMAGMIAGVGRGRPATGCPRGLGRYRPINFDWQKI